MWRCHCSSSTNNQQATILPHHQSHESVVWLEPYSGYWRWRVPHCMGLQCIWTVGSSRCCKANRETCCLATAGGKTIIMYMGCMGDSRCRPGSSTHLVVHLFAECYWACWLISPYTFRSFLVPSLLMSVLDCDTQQQLQVWFNNIVWL